MLTRPEAPPNIVGPALVVQTGFLGDTVLTTPLLSRLASVGPVDVIVRADAAALLEGHPAVRDVIPYDKRGSDRGFAGVRRLARRVRQRDGGDPRGTAVAYLVHASLRSALIPWLANVPVRVGWEGAWAARLLCTHRLPHPHTGHHAERLLAMVPAGGGATLSTWRPSLAPSRRDREEAVCRVAAHPPWIGDTRRLVVLAPGSVWGTKRWPHYPRLAQALRHRFRLALIGGAVDRALAAAIRDVVPEVLDLTGALSLLGTAAVVDAADAVIANDSLAVHLGSAMDTPTVAIYGPTGPAFGFGPLANRHAIVERQDLSCRPCHHHGPARCPLGHHRCMVDLSVPQVLAALSAVLSS